TVVDVLTGSPPASIRIRTADACEYLRAAFRIWVTELRNRWRPASLSRACGCGNGTADDATGDEECLLLAALEVPLVHDAHAGAWLLDDRVPVEVHEERRPYLLHLRMLQQWLLCGRLAAASSVASASAGPVGPTGPAGANGETGPTGPPGDT